MPERVRGRGLVAAWVLFSAFGLVGLSPVQAQTTDPTPAPEAGPMEEAAPAETAAPAANEPAPAGEPAADVPPVEAPAPVPADGNPTPAGEREALIAEALAMGLITEYEVLAPASATLFAAAPTVGAVAPTSGPLDGGQVVAITGVGFTGATAVAFGEVEATYAVVSAIRIVARVPAADAGGAALIKVTNADDETNTVGSSYTYVAPTVTAVVPAYASPTTASVVTITGTGFLGADTEDVTFNGVNATEVLVVSDTQIVATTPITDEEEEIEVEEGSDYVVVTRNEVASAEVAGAKFLFTPAAPAITGLEDAEGDPVTGTNGVATGSLLTLAGTDLWAVTKVNFGTVAVTAPADIVVAEDGDSMTVKVPVGKAGPVNITVTNVRGTSAINLATRFTYIGTVAPKITSVVPNVLDKADEDGGGTFLVTGSGFSGVGTGEVTLDCTEDVTPTAVVVVSDTSIIVTVPGNGDEAEACGLKIENPVDNTKTVTLANGVTYV